MIIEIWPDILNSGNVAEKISPMTIKFANTSDNKRITINEL